MKLIGNLKKQVEETNSKKEAKELIKEAGMLLTDEELDNVTGGCKGEGEGEYRECFSDKSPDGLHHYEGIGSEQHCIYCGCSSGKF